MGGDLYKDSGMVVTSSSGSYMEPEMFGVRYRQVLLSSGLKNISYHVLRFTFAKRAREQGINAEMLSAIMGLCSISQVVDTTNIHAQDYQKVKAMSLMEDLYISMSVAKKSSISS